MRKISILGIAILLLFSSVSVFAGGKQEAGEKSVEDLKIGVLWCIMAAPAIQLVDTGAKAKAEELGVKLIVMDGEWDAAKQSDQLNNLIAQQVDAIILNSVDSKSIVPAVKKAHEAGIPVIAAAINVDDSGKDYITSFVGGNELSVGRIAGKGMVEALGSKGGKVVIVAGAPGAEPAAHRTNGFVEIIEKNSQIEILDVQNTPAWDRAEAMSIMEDYLVKYPALDGVWVHDDNMAMGVIEAVKAAGKIGQIKIISYNGNKDGVAAVKAGEIYATAEQPLAWESGVYVETAVKAAMGEPVEKWVDSSDQIILISSENADQFDPVW